MRKAAQLRSAGRERNSDAMGGSYEVHKPAAPIDWVVEVPGSKSMTNRALLMAALADGVTTLKGVLFSDDSRNFLGSLQSLGLDRKSTRLNSSHQ